MPTTCPKCKFPFHTCKSKKFTGTHKMSTSCPKYRHNLFGPILPTFSRFLQSIFTNVCMLSTLRLESTPVSKFIAIEPRFGFSTYTGNLALPNGVQTLNPFKRNILTIQKGIFSSQTKECNHRVTQTHPGEKLSRCTKRT